MPVVVGIRFKDSGKTYFFDPNGFEALEQGDPVIVETVRGLELAKVAYGAHNVSDDEIVGELRPVIRRAEDTDFERMRLLSERHVEVLERCAEKVGEHSLPMRLIKAEYSFDGSRLTFYFTADKRIDFRALVRDLARTFKTRIELRQIGPRDEAKLLGGIGPCGRMLCCATFLPDYARVSIKMAKDQDLPLNPSKISGVCGRLLCCLSYEHEQYVQIKGELPRKGSWVQTPDGPGEVVSVNVIRETVSVELAGSGIREEYQPSQLSEATQRVHGLAQSRAEEGITPQPQRERRDPAARPSRDQKKNNGERRLLRDTMEDPEVLEALAILEEGFDESQAAELHSELGGPASAPGRTNAPSANPRQPPHPARPPQREPRAEAGGEPPADEPSETADEVEAEAPDGVSAADRSQSTRRRRRRGGKPGRNK